MLGVVCSIAQCVIGQVPPALAKNPSPPPLKYDFTAHIPPLDLEHVANLALSTHASKALWTGGIILTLGLTYRGMREFWEGMHGRDTHYLKQLVIIGMLTAVMVSYVPFTMGIISHVSHMGPAESSVSQLDKSFAERKVHYEAHRIATRDPSLLNVFSIEAWKVAAMELTVDLLYVLVSSFMFILQTVQLFALSAFLFFGPILLGFAALGSFFVPLAIGWFWGIVEVSAWSVTSDVMLFVYKECMGASTSYSAAEEIAVSITMMSIMLSVPVITSMMVRGGHAAATMHSTMFVTGAIYSQGKEIVGTMKSAISSLIPGKAVAGAVAGTGNAVGGGIARSGAWLGSKVATRAGSGASRGGSGRSDVVDQALKRYFGEQKK